VALRPPDEQTNDGRAEDDGDEEERQDRAAEPEEQRSLQGGQ